MTTIFEDGAGALGGGSSGGGMGDAGIGGAGAALVSSLGGNFSRTSQTASTAAQANVPTGSPDGTPTGTTASRSRRKRRQRDTILTGVEETTGTVRTAEATGI